MSDAPAAPVQENGVPPVAEDSKTTVTPGFKVFAGNLSYSTTDEGLKAFFAPVESDIISAQVIQRRSRHGSRSAGYGFVALTTIDAAQKAVEALNKTELDGRTVIVEIAKPAEEKSKEPRPQRRPKKRSGGRRGPRSAPGEVTDAEANGEITDKAEAAPGTVPSATPAADGAEKPKKKKKKTHRRNKPKSTEGETSAPTGDAPPTDSPEEDAPKPRYRRSRPPRPSRPAGEDPVGEPSKTVLFVANLGFNIDDDGLAALFTDAGLNVVSARIIRKRWKPRRSKGYGFVDVGDEAEQKKAIDALQGKEVGGRAIAVKVAVNAPHEDGAAKDTADDKALDAVVVDEA